MLREPSLVFLWLGVAPSDLELLTPKVRTALMCIGVDKAHKNHEHLPATSGMFMSSRLLETTLIVLIALTAVSIAQAQRVDSGMVIDNVTLISPERMAPLEHADVV